MPTTWKGKNWAFLGDDYDLIPGIGIITTRRFAGAGSEMLPRALSLYNSGFETHCVRDQDSPIWRVQGVAQVDTNIVDTHELHGNVLNPSNLTSPFLKSQFGGTTQVDSSGRVIISREDIVDQKISFVSDLANQFASGKRSYDNIVSFDILSTESPLEPGEIGVAIRLLNELIQGVTHYIQFQYVYRHTFNFGRISTMRSGIGNVGCVFTAAQLINAENIPDGESDDIRDLAGEWLKIFPQKLNQLGQRRQVTREYWWADRWSLNYYPTAL